MIREPKVITKSYRVSRALIISFILISFNGIIRFSYSQLQLSRKWSSNIQIIINLAVLQSRPPWARGLKHIVYVSQPFKTGRAPHGRMD